MATGTLSFFGNGLVWLSLNTCSQSLVNVSESRRFEQIKLVNFLRVASLSVSFSYVTNNPKIQELKTQLFITAGESTSLLGGSDELGQTGLISDGFITYLHSAGGIAGYWPCGIAWHSCSGIGQLLSGNDKDMKSRLLHKAAKSKKVKKYIGLLMLGLRTNTPLLPNSIGQSEL